MKKIRVLFVCVHNSARSQMAEALLSHLKGDLFEVDSAGLEPGSLNPLAIEAMADFGIDISQKKTQSVFDLFKAGKSYNFVITVCAGSQGERCPIFPGRTQRLHWNFTDPSSLTGTKAEQLAKTIEIRNKIKEHIEEFISRIEEITA